MAILNNLFGDLFKPLFTGTIFTFFRCRITEDGCQRVTEDGCFRILGNAPFYLAVDESNTVLDLSTDTLFEVTNG